MAVEEFVKRTLELVDQEREAEINENQFLTEQLSAKELQRRGVCLLKMTIKSRKSGLYGRTVVVFEPQNKHHDKESSPELPSHNFTPGDIVGVAFMKSMATEKPMAIGIVSCITTSSINIAFDESQDVFALDDNELFKLTKLANDVTYRRLKATLNELAKQKQTPSQRLINTFFCLDEISSPSGNFPITFVNESLDASQQDAVCFALTQKEVAIIHGPPGTGKTTTVVELIIQAVRKGMKILATAPSNVAVDNLVEKLASYKQRIVRVGHPARLLSHLQKFSLDAIVSGSEEKGIARDVKADIEKVMSKLRKARGHGEKSSLRSEMKVLKKELTEREEAATREILSRADVVLVTLTSASNDGPLKHLKEDHFDLVVIDECSQALEAACWIGLLHAPRCVLAGDHLQLPPTILSKEAAKAGLELTLMERLLNMLVKEKGKDVVRMLTTQYRMHSDIMTWASDQLYQGKLKAHQSVASHLLKDLDEITETETTSKPLLLIDTAGCDLYELELAEEVSKGNEGEANIVATHVEELIQSGVKEKDIAVIAPYNLQVELLRVRLSKYLPDLEVKSVDGFQGREKEAVVISMVRSNSKGEVGFLAEKRRINVAVTRARRHLTIVCDSETVCRDSFIKSLVDYVMEHGEVMSAQQYAQDEVNANYSRPEKLSYLLETEKDKKLTATKQKSRLAQQQTVTSRGSTLQSKEEKTVEFEKILQDFVSNPAETCKNFPSSLNSHDRMVIHEVAERLGLSHISVGEEKLRFIRVSKIPLKDNTSTLLPMTDNNSRHALTSLTSNVMDDHGIVKEIALAKNQYLESSCISELSRDLTDVPESEDDRNKTESSVKELFMDEQKKNDSSSDSIQKDVSASINQSDLDNVSLTEKNNETETKSVSEFKTCEHCQKQIRAQNFILHEAHCSTHKRNNKSNGQEVKHSSQAELGARKKEPQAKSKKHTGPKNSQVQRASDALKKVDSNDLDSMLDSIKELDSKCAFKKCKTPTNTLGRHCEFCTMRFCLSHLMPEIHGCGDAAKESARRIISRDGVLHRGSGVPNHKPSATQRGFLEKKMEKKMGELSGKRSRKKKDESK